MHRLNIAFQKISQIMLPIVAALLAGLKQLVAIAGPLLRQFMTWMMRRAPDQADRPDAMQSYAQGTTALKQALRPVIAVSAVVNILMLTGSIYMLQVYDRVLSSGSVPTLVGLFIIVIILYLFLGVFDFLRSRMLSRCSAILDVNTGSKLFESWVSQTENARSRPPPLSDLDTVRGFLTGPGTTALLDLPWAPMFFAILFVLHPLLGWATVFGAVIGGVIAYLTWKVTANSTVDSTSAFEAERMFASKSHRMSEMVRAMGLQAALTTRWRQMRNQGLGTMQQGSEPAEALKSASKAVRMLTQSTILTVGAFLVLRGELSAGLIIASSILSGRALAPLDQLIGSWQNITRAKAAHARLKSLSDGETDSVERLALPNPIGQLTVDGATLEVPIAENMSRRILDSLSFELSPGDALGVVGNSASGKTSLARMLIGVAAPTDGEVRLDGATFAQWGHDRVGRFIGYLPQRVDLLNGTVADNISRLYPDAEDKDIILAAKRTGLHETIMRMPDGYQTVVGTAGTESMLSGGQVQRLGLARAIFGDPKLVVLDEPNANLDREGDQSLTAVIKDLRARMTTVVVIAHRQSALEAVNKIVVLRDGKIQSFGPIEKFLSQGQAQSAKPADLPKPPEATLAAPKPEPASDPGTRTVRLVRTEPTKKALDNT